MRRICLFLCSGLQIRAYTRNVNSRATGRLTSTARTNATHAMHLKLPPHECSVCGTPFKRKPDLKRHHISYHTDHWQGSRRRKDAEGVTATASSRASRPSSSSGLEHR
ncbi:hypothetical protein OH76DRAFT_1097584 [Lentinus brumalis]|uniref:C2H2-type domain-containing protein n=1 Tax=Lentinus brumalis TaxID=2498619 RepID=A0A371CVS8_9APHY|nr:hypothetical protein OH76DRAFT_1097584 [Polyporus brumalis]